MGNKTSAFGQGWEDTVSLAVDIPVPFSVLLSNEELFQHLFIPHNTTRDKAELTINHLKRFFGNHVAIVEATRYKVPLSQKQLTSLIFFHEYIVVKTQTNGNTHYWAFQKNSKHIRITLSSNLQRVVNFGYGKTQGSIQKRLKGTYWTPTQIQSKPANYDLYELIRWAYENQIQKQKYNLFISNCKCFSRTIFEKVTNNQII